MVFAPKRTVTTLPAANSVPASALWEMAVTLPVLPPVPVLLLVQEPVLLVQEPVPVLPVLLLEPVLLPEPRRNAALARMHRFFQVLLRTVFH